jgi:ferritin-like metal-binding protein YciE
MDTVNDLVDLLAYYVKNLQAAEEQIDGAMQRWIEKAHHSSLKNALKHHASLTAEQVQRLVRVNEILREKKGGSDTAKNDAERQTKGIGGLIEEINQLLNGDISNEVLDAAIIASVQKIEHYEICAYGTAHAFAQQLRLHNVGELLNETLHEEYDADDLLTSLAKAALNKEAIPTGMEIDERIPGSVDATEGSEEVKNAATFSISERTINSPGGRAGTSHRRYGTGESRGH